MNLLSWLSEHRHLRRANRALRRDLLATQHALEVAHSTNKAMEHLRRCTEPVTHLRLAHELEQSQARLAEIEGVDPHLASLPPVSLEALEPRGGDVA